MFSSLRFKGNFVPDNTCSISDCLFSRISSQVLSRSIPGIVI